MVQSYAVTKNEVIFLKADTQQLPPRWKCWYNLTGNSGMATVGRGCEKKTIYHFGKYRDSRDKEAYTKIAAYSPLDCMTVKTLNGEFQ